MLGTLYFRKKITAVELGWICTQHHCVWIRGENRLHRRWLIARQGLHRRRFPHALGPVVPSFRCLVSAAEVAHLLELPSARMKAVPVRRLTIPRIPAPPEVTRGSRARRAGASDVVGIAAGSR